MSIKQVTQSRYGFVVLQGIAEGASRFKDIHAVAGCPGKTVCWTLKLCIDNGLVRGVPPAGYAVTARGNELLANWAPIVAMDGEPGSMADPLPMSGGWSFEEPPIARPAAGAMSRVQFAQEALARAEAGTLNRQPRRPAMVAAGNGMARAFAAHALAPGEQFTELDEDPFAPKRGDL